MKRSIGVVETVPVECLYIKLTGITTKDKLSLREARNERRSLSGGADGQSPNVNRRSEIRGQLQDFEVEKGEMVKVQERRLKGEIGVVHRNLKGGKGETEC